MMRIGSDIYIGLKELANFGVSYNYAKKKVSQNRYGRKATWQSVKQGVSRLVSYDSLPTEQKAKLPTRQELLLLIANEESKQAQGQRSLLLARIKVLIEEKYRDITDYHTLKSSQLTDQKAMDLTMASGILRFIQAYPTKTKTRELGVETNKALQELVLAYLADLKRALNRELYGFKVNNLRILQERVRKWKKTFEFALENSPETDTSGKRRVANRAAVLSLIPDHFGNNRARKIGKVTGEGSILIAGGRIDLSEYHARKLLLLYTNPGTGQKFDFENIYLRYQQLCAEDQQEPVSISSIKNFLSSQAVKQYATWERDGWVQHDKQLPHVRGVRPEYALQKGGYDGFQVDFKTYVQSEEKLFMLTVVFVADYFSEAITGYDIGLVENGKMVRNMYRNHLNSNNYHSYIEIESDRFSGNMAADTRGVFEKCCQYISQPRPNDPQGKAPNPKSRFVERIVAEVNRLAQNTRGWKGTNITSIDKQRKPNPDYAEYVSTYQAGIHEIIKLINIYNNQELKKYHGKSRIAQFNKHKHPDAPQIPMLSAAQLLNQSRVTSVRNELVKIKLNGQIHEYDFPQAFEKVWMMAPGKKVKVYYDENNMEEVDVFGFVNAADSQTETYIATLKKVRRIRRDKHGQQAEDFKELTQITKRRKSINKEVNRKLLEVEATEYGIEAAVYPLDHLGKLVAGARAQAQLNLIKPIDQLYSQALSTDEAQMATSYYTERLITGQGMQTIPSQTDSKVLEKSRRSYIERRRNRRKKQD